MNVLLLGSGGREHALAWKISQSPLLKTLYAAPGSDAIAGLAERAQLDILDGEVVAAFCRKKHVSLVVIGPEAPLEAGMADGLRAEGLLVFGPGRSAARLESSKAHAKDFMKRHHIPTARYEVFNDSQAARSAAEAWRLPVVVKADGLAAGKGVFVCSSTNEALGAISEIMDRKILGRAGETVVIEDALQGEELSVMAFVDGSRYEFLPFSRDHKRLQDGDRGPNTGGMGAYAPVPVDTALLKNIREQVFDRTLAGLKAEGLDYRGLLYAGLMLTRKGPMVLEYNCRFGDPETQAVLPLIDSDLLDTLRACAEGRLDQASLRIKPGSALCVTLASRGYPGKIQTGQGIKGLPSGQSADSPIFHAGTAKSPQGWITTGGRVLSVTGFGKNLDAARERAYASVSKIRFEGMQYRKDIAEKVAAAR